MSWFNYYGLIIVAIILTPNIVYAVKNKGVVILSNLSPDERISVTVIGARLLTSADRL